jgi:hypothetical protein
MQAMPHFPLELRHATMPTYVASYLFPFLLFVYETHRVGRWIFDYGMNFSNVSAQSATPLRNSELPGNVAGRVVTG